MALIEELYVGLTERFSEKRILETPFPRLRYQEAIDRFGNDRPDLRFGLELHDVTDAFRDPIPRVCSDTRGGRSGQGDHCPRLCRVHQARD